MTTATPMATTAIMRTKSCALGILMLALVGCDSPQPGNGDAGYRAELSYTHYTDASELFVEFPALVAGQPSRFIAHFTRLADHKPVTEGRVDVVLRRDGGIVAGFRVSSPTRDGLFTPVVTPKSAGDFDLAVILHTGNGKVTHELGPVTVFADAAAVSVNQAAVEGEISFQKEQQWQSNFASVPAKPRPMRPSAPGFATVMAPADGGADIPAPGDGYFSSQGLAKAGQQVEAGETLGYLIPRLGTGADLGESRVAFERARSALALAKADVQRLTPLFEQGAIPRRRLDEAQQSLRVAQAEFQAAQSRLTQTQTGAEASGLALRAPVAGEVIDVQARPGAFVRAGERVFRIATPTRRWLQVRVPEHYAAQLHATSGAWFDHPVTGTQILDGTTGARVVQVSASVEPKSRTASVTLEYPRETGPDLVGSRFAAHLFTRPAEPRLAVPRSALVDDGGRQVVFIHSGGETFARREVQTGIVDGDWIEIVSGLSAGERVVSQGAWSVRLAASGGDDIGHGHAH